MIKQRRQESHVDSLLLASTNTSILKHSQYVLNADPAARLTFLSRLYALIRIFTTLLHK